MCIRDRNLRNVIINELKTITHLSTSDSPRMYIDRVFHKKGHGTIVTGTLINSVFETDENIYIDGKLKSKIRSMEAYENSVSRAESKVRLAMNLSNINYSDLKRGSVITNNDKNVLHKSFVANIRMTDSYAKSIKHNSIVEVFIGSSQAKGRLIFYDSKILNKDQSTYALIKLDNLIHYRIYDKVILRSSGTTIAGGEIAVLDGVTAGTVTASKALVVDSNKDIGSIRNKTNAGEFPFFWCSSRDVYNHG